MKKVFVSGPLTSYGERQQNIFIANLVGKIIYELGHAPYVPHQQTEMISQLTEDVREETYLQSCIEFLNCCDVMVQLPGWEYSTGSLTEYWHVMEKNMPVILLNVDYDNIKEFEDKARKILEDNL